MLTKIHKLLESYTNKHVIELHIKGNAVMHFVKQFLIFYKMCWIVCILNKCNIQLVFFTAIKGITNRCFWLHPTNKYFDVNYIVLWWSRQVKTLYHCLPEFISYDIPMLTQRRPRYQKRFTQPTKNWIHTSLLFLNKSLWTSCSAQDFKYALGFILTF